MDSGYVLLVTIRTLAIMFMSLYWKLWSPPGPAPNAGSCVAEERPIRARKRSSDKMATAFRSSTAIWKKEPRPKEGIIAILVGVECMCLIWWIAGAGWSFVSFAVSVWSCTAKVGRELYVGFERCAAGCGLYCRAEPNRELSCFAVYGVCQCSWMHGYSRIGSHIQCCQLSGRGFTLGLGAFRPVVWVYSQLGVRRQLKLRA